MNVGYSGSYGSGIQDDMTGMEYGALALAPIGARPKPLPPFGLGYTGYAA